MTNNFTQDIFNLSIPVLALDIVIFTIYKGNLCVLLTTKNEEPYEGSFILPGGIVRNGISLEDNFDEILLKKTGAKGIYKEQLYTFGDSNRDPRGHVISVTYYALVDNHTFINDVDFTKVQIVEYSNLPNLNIGFDHLEIIKYAKQRLDWKFEYTNVSKNLLKEEFTLSQLQGIYEIVYNKLIDKRNFRKKIFSTELVAETGNMDKSSNRPARLYSFVDKELKIVNIGGL